MDTYLVLLLIAYFNLARSAATIDQQDQNVTSSNDSYLSTYSLEEKIKALRIEMVKYQLNAIKNLEEMRLAGKNLTKESRQIVSLMLQDEDKEEWQNLNDLYDESDEGLTINTTSSVMQCVASNESYCRVFRYQMSPTLNASEVYIWIYKISEYPRWISLSLSHLSPYQENHVFHYNASKVGWIKLPLPNIWIPPTSDDVFLYSVEVIGQNYEYTGIHRPYLTVSNSSVLTSRQRRETSQSAHCDESKRCCKKDLVVEFDKIGLDFAVHPTTLNIFYCIGKCVTDEANFDSFYQLTLFHVLEHHPTLRGALGDCWKRCCRPKMLETKRMIYTITTPQNHTSESNITGLVIKDCGCW